MPIVNFDSLPDDARTWDVLALASAPKPPPPPPPRPVLLAHRGGALEADVPENSLPALRYAVSRGADILEFDLHATSDGVLVLMHDDTLDRTTNGKGLADDFTLADANLLFERWGRYPTVRAMVAGSLGYAPIAQPRLSMM